MLGYDAAQMTHEAGIDGKYGVVVWREISGDRDALLRVGMRASKGMMVVQMRYIWGAVSNGEKNGEDVLEG